MMRRAAMSPIVCVLAAAGLVYAAGGPEEPAAPAPRTALAAGVLSQSNSKAGSAILQAAGMKPGSSVTGTVTIRNTGTLAGDYTLSRSNLTDSRGPNGGALSSRLALRVEDVTRTPRTIYQGALATMAAQRLGRFARGEGRTYRFTVTFPDGGFPAGPRVGDNSFRGSSTTVRYDWTAVAASGVGGLRIRLRGGSASLRRGVIALTAGCGSVACRLRAGGSLAVPAVTKPFRLRAVAVRALAGKAAKVRIKIPARARQAIQAALSGHRPVTARITVAATDASGRKASTKLSVRVKR
jgi:spore coat-associated protein N